jgi:1-deoxy-D-xylulose-5-phosphate synthase
LTLASGVADLLAARGYSVGIVDARFVVPLDEALLDRQMALSRCFLTIENGVASGGFGSAVEEFLIERGYKGNVVRAGWPREFIPHGAPALLAKKYGMTPEALADKVTRVMNKQG